MISCNLQLSMVLMLLLLQLLLKSTLPKAAAHTSREGLARVSLMGQVRGLVMGGSRVPGMMRLPAGKLGKLLPLLPQLWCHPWAIDLLLPPLRLQLQQVSLIHNIIGPYHPSPPTSVPVPLLPTPSYLAPRPSPSILPTHPLLVPTPSPFYLFSVS